MIHLYLYLVFNNYLNFKSFDIISILANNIVDIKHVINHVIKDYR